MVYICPLCAIDPLNHSLKKLKENDNIVIYYTCPSKAKLYFDYEGIIKHYDGVLSEIPSHKKWVWIFDSFNFNLNHFIELKVGIELAKLISNKFSDNLQKIIVINPTIYTSITYKVVKPFLGNKITGIIDFNNKIKNINDILIDL